MSGHNESAIRKFLELLDPSTDKNCYWLSDPGSNEPLEGLSSLILTADGLIKVLKNNPGAEPHITINQTKGARRQATDMLYARAVVSDMDTPMTEEEVQTMAFKYQPHLVVSTSKFDDGRMKTHFYWLIDHGIALKDWQELQLGLIGGFGGDINFDQVQKTIRVPGSMRVTKEGEKYTTELVAVDTYTEPYSLKQIYRLFPKIGGTWLEKGRAMKQEHSRALKRAYKQRGAIDNSTVKVLGRNVALYSQLCAAIMHSEIPSVEETITTAYKLNQLFDEPKEDREVERIARSAWLRGNGKREWLEKIRREKLKAFREAYEGEIEDDTGRVEKEHAGSDERKRSKKRARADTREKGRMHTNHGLYANGRLPDGGDGGLRARAKGDEKSVVTTGGGHEDSGSKSSRPAKVSGAAKVKPRFEYDYTDSGLRITRFTERGIVERIKQRFPDHIVRVGSDTLYAFDSRSKRWKVQKSGNTHLLAMYAHRCIKDMFKDPKFIKAYCSDAKGKPSFEKLLKQKDKWYSSRTVNGVLSLIKSDAAWTQMRVEDFDANPYELFCANGVLDLRTRKLREASADDFLLKQTDVEFHADAECPWRLEFLKSLYAKNDNPEQIVSFVQEMFGYVLTGSVDQQLIFIHAGEGANGKSRILEALETLMGEYAVRVDPKVIAMSRNGASPELTRVGAAIEGARLALIDDLDVKTQWNEAIVKALTESRLVRRYLYEEVQSIPNRAKVVIGCNQVPSVQESNYGIFRRLCILDYKQRFKVDPAKAMEIRENVRRELSGILNWSLDGLNRTTGIEDHRQLIAIPMEVKQSGADYQETEIDVEALIANLYISGDPHIEEHWLTMQDIQKTVALSFDTQGLIQKAPSVETIGRIIKSCGFQCLRKRVSGIMTRSYCMEQKETVEEAAPIAMERAKKGVDKRSTKRAERVARLVQESRGSWSAKLKQKYATKKQSNNE